MSLYKVGIVGYGTVGNGIYNLFKDNVVAIYDPYAPEEVNGLPTRFKDPFSNVDLVVICVPTNKSNGSNSADTSIVWDSLKWLSNVVKKDTILLIKSTTPPAELEKMSKTYNHIVFSPEYMGESKYYTPSWKYPDPSDIRSHTWQIFGGNPQDTSKCVDIFKRKMSVDAQFLQTDIVAAGLVKYMENSFFATKVTFCNEWFDIAQNYGVDFNELRELWLLDPRINRNHTLVFPKDRGYAGKCFPKDVKAIISDCENKKYKAELLKAVDGVNAKFRKGKV